KPVRTVATSSTMAFPVVETRPSPCRRVRCSPPNVAASGTNRSNVPIRSPQPSSAHQSNVGTDDLTVTDGVAAVELLQRTVALAGIQRTGDLLSRHVFGDPQHVRGGVETVRIVLVGAVEILAAQLPRGS